MGETNETEFNFDEYLMKVARTKPGHEKDYENEDIEHQEFLNKMSTLIGNIDMGNIDQLDQVQKVVEVIDKSHREKYLEERKKMMEDYAEMSLVAQFLEAERQNDELIED